MKLDKRYSIKAVIIALLVVLPSALVIFADGFLSAVPDAFLRAVTVLASLVVLPGTIIAEFALAPISFGVEVFEKHMTTEYAVIAFFGAWLVWSCLAVLVRHLKVKISFKK